jgi:predicted DNA-binding antitoxin AbrB/MazE fold protein
MSMKTKAIYEKGTLKLLEKIDLKEGEEVEIEVKKKGISSKKNILKYAGILKDLNEKEEKLFEDTTKRRKIFERTLKI